MTGTSANQHTGNSSGSDFQATQHINSVEYLAFLELEPHLFRQQTGVKTQNWRVPGLPGRIGSPV
jgi:hypothetical protein